MCAVGRIYQGADASSALKVPEEMGNKHPLVLLKIRNLRLKLLFFFFF